MYYADGLETKVKDDLFDLLSSFTNDKIGAEFILAYPAEFKEIFFNSSEISGRFKNPCIHHIST